jgi:SPP1 gp7 family putative phage head morphogenesis protein
MGTQTLHQMTAEAVKRKFAGSPGGRRKRLLPSKVVPHYPDSIEREYERIANAYMKLFNSALAAHLPKLRVLLDAGSPGGSGEVRADSGDRRFRADDEQPPVTPKRTGAEVIAFGTSVELLFEEITQDFVTKQGLFDLYGRIEKLTKLTRKLTIAEWKRVVKRTLGIDIMTDYYSDLKFQSLMDKWVADNVALIKTVPQEMLGKMKDIAKQGYLDGATSKTIAKQIQEAYGVDKNHALFIARDQTAKLNAQITQEQQRDAGVSEYIWRTMDDSRVRGTPKTGKGGKSLKPPTDNHYRLNGTRQKWSEPPIVDSATGRRCHPGEDYQCRCVALPVFDLDGIVLPWEKSKESE